MNEHEARKVLYDAAMRKGLLNFIWGFRMAEQEKQGFGRRPMPSMDDDQIKKELKRIILGK